MELLTLFNSVDGVYGEREPNVVAAVNFAYNGGEFSGQAYFMYTTVELANFAVGQLRDRELHGRELYVVHSDRRLNAGTSRHGNTLGRSRVGAAIWDCAPPRSSHCR